MTLPQRFLLDTNVFDRIVEDRELMSAIERDRPGLFVTTIQDRELMSIRDEEKKAAIVAFWIEFTERIEPATSAEWESDPRVAARARRMLADFQSAFAASNRSLTFVTQDRKFVQAIEGTSIRVVDFDEFRRLILDRGTEADRERDDFERNEDVSG